jgi:hypothetical protein
VSNLDSHGIAFFITAGTLDQFPQSAPRVAQPSGSPDLSTQHQQLCLASGDALDAVICIYAAAAFAIGKIESEANTRAQSEGHIAIHC